MSRLLLNLQSRNLKLLICPQMKLRYLILMMVKLMMLNLQMTIHCWHLFLKRKVNLLAHFHKPLYLILLIPMLLHLNQNLVMALLELLPTGDVAVIDELHLKEGLVRNVESDKREILKEVKKDLTRKEEKVLISAF